MNTAFNRLTLIGVTSDKGFHTFCGDLTIFKRAKEFSHKIFGFSTKHFFAIKVSTLGQEALVSVCDLFREIL